MRTASAKTLVVGLGKTGASVARFLRRRSVPFMAADSRRHPPAYDEFRKRYPRAEVRLGDFDERFFLTAGDIVLSPGVPLQTPAVQSALAAGIPVSGDVELFARALDSEGTGVERRAVIAVTGSNGKSTVVTLVANMAARAGLKVRAGGNLGPPALDLIANAERADLYVLELSSFQLETTRSLAPAASAVLNVSEDHSDRYSSFSDYVRAKHRVHRGSRTVVLNREDVHQAAPGPGVDLVSFGLDAARAGQFGIARTEDGPAITYGARTWIACHELKGLPGDSGALNAQAALALGHAVGLPRAAMLKVLRDFRGLPHRQQLIGTRKGVVWIDDSKATNVMAAVAALANLTRPCVWLAGGDGKGADFSPLREAAARVHTAILFGRDAPALADAVSGVAHVQFARDLDDAVNRAHAAAGRGECVLLSPACSSLDQFSGYAERGERFALAFEGLAP